MCKHCCINAFAHFCCFYRFFQRNQIRRHSAHSCTKLDSVSYYCAGFLCFCHFPPVLKMAGVLKCFVDACGSSEHMGLWGLAVFPFSLYVLASYKAMRSQTEFRHSQVLKTARSWHDSCFCSPLSSSCSSVKFCRPAGILSRSVLLIVIAGQFAAAGWKRAGEY